MQGCPWCCMQRCRVCAQIRTSNTLPFSRPSLACSLRDRLQSVEPFGRPPSAPVPAQRHLSSALLRVRGRTLLGWMLVGFDVGALYVFQGRAAQKAFLHSGAARGICLTP